MKKIEIRPDGSKRVYTVNLDVSMTDPSWKDDCDVNIILRILHMRNYPERLLHHILIRNLYI